MFIPLFIAEIPTTRVQGTHSLNCCSELQLSNPLQALPGEARLSPPARWPGWETKPVPCAWLGTLAGKPPALIDWFVFT